MLTRKVAAAEASEAAWTYRAPEGSAPGKLVELTADSEGVRFTVTQEMFTGTFMKDVRCSVPVPAEHIDELIAFLEAAKARA